MFIYTLSEVIGIGIFLIALVVTLVAVGIARFMDWKDKRRMDKKWILKYIMKLL